MSLGKRKFAVPKYYETTIMDGQMVNRQIDRQTDS
jgi:hypothetical protein